MLKGYTAVIILFLAFSSCSKKKEEVRPLQQTYTHYEPSTKTELDTTGAYISPTDFFRDNSLFETPLFNNATVTYMGERNVRYTLFVHPLKSGSDTITLVAEHLSGKIKYTRADGSISIEDTSSVSRLLFYLNGILYFRKAFPVVLDEAEFFPTVRLFYKTYFDAAPTKTIIYYWTDEIPYGANYNNNLRREYHAVGVDKEGVVYDLTGYFHRVSDNLDAVRFLSEDRVAASVVPNSQYRNLAIDVVINIDWETSTTSLEFPRDTIFSVFGKPDRYFTRTLKLYAEPTSASVLKEVKLRTATKAQVLQLFAPSVLGKEYIGRDRLFVQFSAANKGWVDYETMVYEEIIAEK
jgi:hypothetical protein